MSLKTRFDAILIREHNSLRAFYSELCELLQADQEELAEVVSSYQGTPYYNLAHYVFELYFMVKNQGLLLDVEPDAGMLMPQATWFEGDCFKNMQPDITSHRWKVLHAIPYAKVKQAIESGVL